MTYSEQFNQTALRIIKTAQRLGYEAFAFEEMLLGTDEHIAYRDAIGVYRFDDDGERAYLDMSDATPHGIQFTLRVPAPDRPDRGGAFAVRSGLTFAFIDDGVMSLSEILESLAAERPMG